MEVAQVLAAAPQAAPEAPGAYDRAIRARVAQALMMQGATVDPVQHWTQGLARVAQALTGGYQLGQVGKEAQDEDSRAASVLANLPGTSPIPGSPPPSPMASAPAPAQQGPLVGTPAGGGQPQLASAAPPVQMASAAPTGPMPGSAGSRVAGAFDDIKAGIDAGTVDPQGAANNLGTPPAPMAAASPAPAPVAAASAPPPAAPSAAGPQIDPATAKYIQALMVNPQTRPFAMKLYESAVARAAPNYNFHVFGDQIVRTDQHGGGATVMPGLSATKPTFHQIDPEKGAAGFIDPASRKFTPLEGVPAETSNSITMPNGSVVTKPAGVDGKIWKQEMTRISADAQAGKMTAEQAKDASFAVQMHIANKALEPVEKLGSTAAGAGSQALNKIPLGLGNFMRTGDQQKYEHAKNAFLSGLLRQESGASIHDPEYIRRANDLFPQPGDTPGQIALKGRMRQLITEQMEKSAGPAYRRPRDTAPAVAAPAAAASSDDGWSVKRL